MKIRHFYQTKKAVFCSLKCVSKRALYRSYSGPSALKRRKMSHVTDTYNPTFTEIIATLLHYLCISNALLVIKIGSKVPARIFTDVLGEREGYENQTNPRSRRWSDSVDNWYWPLTLVIKQSGRGNIGSLQKYQREAIEGAVNELLQDRFGDRFLKPVEAYNYGKSGKDYVEISHIPSSSIDDFNEYLDEKIADGYLFL